MLQHLFNEDEACIIIIEYTFFSVKLLIKTFSLQTTLFPHIYLYCLANFRLTYLALLKCLQQTLSFYTNK